MDRADTDSAITLITKVRADEGIEEFECIYLKH